MARQIYRKVGDKWCWTEVEDRPVEAPSAAVLQDTFKTPLRHPVTDEIIDSASKWNRINKENGLECVGNDVLSKHERRTKDHVSEEVIRDAMAQTEAIYSDPSKRRAWENRNLEMTHNHQQRLTKRD